MTRISIKLTSAELDLLTSLASDQLFRREFIDPKLPGYKSNPGDVRVGKELVARLRSRITAAPANPRRVPVARKA